MSVALDTMFLDALASKTPLPAGGSAAAYAGAMAAALVAMVARTTIGKRGYAEVEARMTELVTLAEAQRIALQQAVAADSAAYADWIAARRAGDPAAIEDAAQRAANVPLETAAAARRVLELAVEAAQTGNRNAASDACAAAALAHSAIFVSCLNARINAATLSDRCAAEALETQSHALEAQAGELLARLPVLIQERLGVE